MRKIGISLINSLHLANAEFAKAISEVGFEATFSEMQDAARHDDFANQLNKYGVSFENLHAPFGHINDIWHDGEPGEDMLKDLLACVDCCHRTAIPYMVVHLSSGNNAPPVTDIGRARFTQLVDYAIGKNVAIAFENQRKLANLAWAMETFQDEKLVGFCWDCGHEGCFTPGREYMPLFGNRLIGTHIHDNYGVYNQDSHLVPFDGGLDFPRIARQIRESEFTGSLLLELIPEKTPAYMQMTPVEYLAHAAQAAKRLRDMVDVK